jgi:transposase
MSLGLVRKVVDGGRTVSRQRNVDGGGGVVDQKVLVGVDVGKDAHYGQVITADGVMRFDRPVANNEAAIRGLLADAAGFGSPVVVIDQPASIARLLLAVCWELEVPVAYVTGLQMRRAADLYSGQAKTDPRDAWVLADFARRHYDQLAWLDITDELIAELRILNGRDVDLAHDTNRVSNRLRDALVSVSPGLERAVGDRLHQPGVRDLLSKYPTPTMLRSAGTARIRRVIARRSPRVADKVTDTVTAVLDTQTVVLAGEGRWGQVIADLAADLDRLHQQRKTLETQIQEVFEKHPLGKVLVSLCGFGARTGARTLAEIGDPHRFANGGRLAAYAGFTPVDRQSGTSIRGTSRNRGGNHRLKDAMFIAAFVASQHDPWAKAYYQKKRAEGKQHNAAIVCLARRRCDLILAMLKTATPYNPKTAKAA